MSSDIDNRTIGELRLEWKQSIAQHGRRSVCWADLDTLLEDMLKDRLKLERRIKELEGKPHVKFTGVWKAGAYQPGDAATHHGGLWICRAATSGEPSQDFVGWQLAVKRGDAR
ncbi:MAG TPA: hypothetical protein VNJ03_01460 [Vicinamibacterales bacterium]|nr:hypothetical protein [Vicinamibacterales bacterium]